MRRSFEAYSTNSNFNSLPLCVTILGMKRVLPVLMGFVLLLLSSTEGWSLPRCPGSPTSSGLTAGSWTDCFGTFTPASGDKTSTVLWEYFHLFQFPEVEPTHLLD